MWLVTPVFGKDLFNILCKVEVNKKRLASPEEGQKSYCRASAADVLFSKNDYIQVTHTQKLVDITYIKAKYK